MIAEAAAIGVSILVPTVGFLGGWLRGQSREIADLRVQLAESKAAVAGQYHTKPEIDDMIKRVVEAMGKQIKAELAPVRFRLREISRAMKLPPEIPEDDG